MVVVFLLRTAPLLFLWLCIASTLHYTAHCTASDSLTAHCITASTLQRTVPFTTHSTHNTSTTSSTTHDQTSTEPLLHPPPNNDRHFFHHTLHPNPTTNSKSTPKKPKTKTKNHVLPHLLLPTHNPLYSPNAHRRAVYGLARLQYMPFTAFCALSSATSHLTWRWAACSGAL